MAQQPDTVHVMQNKLAVLNRLVEISLILNSTLDLQPLLDHLMQAATEITSAEAASILLVDRNTNDLYFTAASNASGQGLIGMVVPIEDSIAGRIIEEGRAVIIADAANEPRHYRQVGEQIGFETRNILGVPMRIRDRLVGVLEVVNKKEGQFGEDDLRHIGILSSQAAVAIENARLVESLARAYADLNRVNQIKSDFIAIASHELRTPLGVILGYASFLKEDVTGEAGELADAVLSSALQMRGLIEGMTNLRYVQIEESELELALVDVAELVDAAYADAVALAGAKDQVFEKAPVEKGMLVRVDRAKALLALSNLLNNAIKFTPAGGAILLSAERRSREVWLAVRDNGYGIPPDQLERIFEQFYQVENPMTRHHGGLGLGLAIARAIVERHGGRVWAESPGPDEGSRFIIALPLATGSTAPLKPS